MRHVFAIPQEKTGNYERVLLERLLRQITVRLPIKPTSNKPTGNSTKKFIRYSSY
ncbi:hypothetical protein XNC1_4148 [Xenorhabdus nematophila ATCC 19061]|uniref:Uncharacterized protein n=1 Tax=Xenorhabdus nematophila (strain ATCC 19061 / DSM 3370 / CCUG 14189 / LMG 1036 / NCIMB 9965 / AN6) TaxID=406817 RepID=D3VDD3_XENNA|nr:hypothetical protein XNC1_4148 [Xenorhabdus nematophila ATCC 19061]